MSGNKCVRSKSRRLERPFLISLARPPVCDCQYQLFWLSTHVSITSTLAMTTKLPTASLSSPPWPPTPSCRSPQLTTCHGLGTQLLEYMLLLDDKKSCSGTSSLLSTASLITAPKASGRPHFGDCSKPASSSPDEKARWLDCVLPDCERGRRPARAAELRARSHAVELAA